MKNLQQQFDRRPIDFDRNALWETISLPEKRRRPWWMVWFLGGTLAIFAITTALWRTTPMLGSWPINTSTQQGHTLQPIVINSVKKPPSTTTCSVKTTSYKSPSNTNVILVADDLSTTPNTVLLTTPLQQITLAKTTRLHPLISHEQASDQGSHEARQEQHHVPTLANPLRLSRQSPGQLSLPHAQVAPLTTVVPGLLRLETQMMPPMPIVHQSTQPVRQLARQRLLLGGGIGWHHHHQNFTAKSVTDRKLDYNFSAVEGFAYALQWTHQLNGSLYLFAQGQYTVLQNRWWTTDIHQILYVPPSGEAVETTVINTTYELYHQTSVWELGTGMGYRLPYRKWSVEGELALAYAIQQQQTGQFLNDNVELQSIITNPTPTRWWQPLRLWTDIGISRVLGASPWSVKVGAQLQVGANSPLNVEGQLAPVLPGQLYLKVGRQLRAKRK